MEFELKLVEGGKIGMIVFHTFMTKDLFAGMFQDILKSSECSSLELLIYDTRRFPLEISAFDQYDCIYNHSSQTNNRTGRKIALWVKEEDHSYDFIETLYLNSGRSARRFENYDEAVSWLTADK